MVGESGNGGGAGGVADRIGWGIHPIRTNLVYLRAIGWEMQLMDGETDGCVGEQTAWLCV
ncbi:hypothetical protein AB4Z33_08630 [Paenibacillus sp. 2TAB19]